MKFLALFLAAGAMAAPVLDNLNVGTVVKDITDQGQSVGDSANDGGLAPLGDTVEGIVNTSGITETVHHIVEGITSRDVVSQVVDAIVGAGQNTGGVRDALNELVGEGKGLGGLSNGQLGDVVNGLTNN